MQMNRYFICCEKCFETICKRNTKAAKLWMDFCAFHLQERGLVILHSSDFPELRILEKMGFLISTDQKNSLAIRVHGQMRTTEGDNFFCVKGGRHE
jgi:hypothetical protein